MFTKVFAHFTCSEFIFVVQQNSTFLDAGYPDRLDPSGKFVENYRKLTYLEITGYRIKYRTVFGSRTFESGVVWRFRRIYIL